MDTILFDPTVEKLNKLIEGTRVITAEDLSDDTALAIVHEGRILLRDARITIEKQGKSMREEALKYQKDVIAREKELIAIIEPEEIRLKSLEDEAKLIKEREARKALLPMRKEQLEGLLNIQLEDELILDMDNDEFIVFLNEQKAKKLDHDMAVMAEREAAIADKERIAQVRKDAELAERNRLEEKAKSEEADRIEKAAEAKRQVEREAQKLIDDAKAEAERTVQASRDEEAKRKAQEEAAIREAKVREQQEKDALAKRQAEKNYQIWLITIGYRPEDEVLWIFKHSDDGITGAFKFISSYKQ